MKFILMDKRKEAGDAMSFVFNPAGRFAWQAGQYLHYLLPHANPDPRGVGRHFTISSAPYENQVMLTTRMPETKSTFKAALDALAIGDAIEADELEGDFVVSDPNQDLVFIAGGIGITPFRSILLDLDNKGAQIHCQLLYANRNNDFVFKDELEALGKKHKDFRIIYIVEPERIDEAFIRKEVSDLAKPLFYVSGPKPMVKALGAMMLGMNIAKEHIKQDDFPGYDWP